MYPQQHKDREQREGENKQKEPAARMWECKMQLKATVTSLLKIEKKEKRNP